MKQQFNLKSYLSSLSQRGKEVTIPRLVEIGEITPHEAREIMSEDLEKTLPRYMEAIKSDQGASYIWNLFYNRPDYLTRALVQLMPTVFYSDGIASPIVARMRAKLGPVVIPPATGRGGFDLVLYMKELPEHVRYDIRALYRDCQFLDYLYLMSRDPDLGFQHLKEEMQRTPDSLEREVLGELQDYCAMLFAMQFPDFISEVNGKPFPSFHVRWWIDQIKETKRVMNVGEPSTYKTAFATIGMHQYGCRKVLYLCPPHAREESAEKIASYFRDPKGRVFLVRDKHDIPLAKRSRAQFIVAGYKTLILNTEQGTVFDQLKKIPFDGIVLDESHNINNVGGAQQAQACERLTQHLPLRRLLAMSATPWENDPCELGGIVSMIMPDVVPSAAMFRKWGIRNEHFLREFISRHVVGVSLRDIKDLPECDPKPWEDPFGVELIEPNPWHQELYRFVESDDTAELVPTQKVMRLLHAVTQPHKLVHDYTWPPEWRDRFNDWQLSTKLVWLRRFMSEAREKRAKVVIGTGIYVEGITRFKGDEESREREQIVWVGNLIQEWFGKESGLILDGTVSTAIAKSGSSERRRLTEKWQSSPDHWWLLASMRACKDSIELFLKPECGAEKLYLTALSFPWNPWYQFFYRFLREEQKAPMVYRVPVLRDTIDENLLALNREKFESWERFHARSPITPEYLSRRMGRDSDVQRLAEEYHPDYKQVYIIREKVVGRGEEASARILQESYGISTYGQVFARAFLKTQEFSASGHIARCMGTAIEELERAEETVYRGEDIFDAGCGPLTLERQLDRPVCGVDMNPYMIELGRAHARTSGKHARVGFLSSLPQDWTGKFRLVICALTLHWSRRGETGSDRLSILSELFRVAHPTTGRIWIASMYSSMNAEVHRRWVDAFSAQGCVIVDEFTGLVRAKDGGGAHQFQFWSLCFSPNGNQFQPNNPHLYRFVQEDTRRKTILAKSERDAPEQTASTPVLHRSFEIVPLSGGRLSIAEAAQRSVKKEQDRLAGLSWRVLEKMHQRGLLSELR